jgi:uncharacterized protein DUF4157
MGRYHAEQYGAYAQQVVRRARSAGVPAPQAKLEVGPAGDRFERAADQVAYQVTGYPVPRRAHARGGAALTPDPRCPYGAAGGAVDAGTRQAVRLAAVGGQPIPGRLRAAMERALAADLSEVRIHTGRRADELSCLLRARAFTIGQHVFFRRGAYDPVNPEGRALLAHELTHVVQQQRGAASVIQRDFEPEHQFPGRWQAIVGVGETVKLTVTKSNAGSLAWSDASPQPMGQLGATAVTGEADYIAGGRPGTATLICRDGKGTEVHRHEVKIVDPNDGYMRQAPGTRTRHLPGMWNVSFVGNQFLKPTKVSFHNIEFMEGDAPATYRPSKRAWKVDGQGDHKAGRWVGVERAADSTVGSKCEGDDWVSSGNYEYPGTDPRPAGEPVTLTWSIPWLWRLCGSSGPGQEFTRVDHVAYDYGGGKARLTKGGVDVSALAADPAQWFYSFDDTITQIKGYYGEHPAGYGAAWPVVERRLRSFRDVGPLADLLAAVRERNWTPGEFPPDTSLNDLIDIAAHLWRLPPVPP